MMLAYESLLLGLLAAATAACGTAATERAAPRGDAIEMGSPRAAHASASLPDGRVLLLGGCVGESCEAGAASATAEVYDLRNGRFAPAGRLLDRRVSTASALLPSGEILLAGGWIGSEVTATTEIFDPASGRSRRGPTLSAARADMAVARLPDGRILLAGGYAGSAAHDRVEVFDPRDSTVSIAGNLQSARAGAEAAVLADGRVLIVGGGTSGASGLTPTASAEIFDPATGRSSPTGPLAEARYKHAVVGLPGGPVLVFGGSDARDREGKLRSVERYDPVAGTFSPAGELVEARFKIADAALPLADGRVLIAGGAPRPEVYDPRTRRSELIGPDTGLRLNFASASLLGDGRVLLAGGYDEAGIRMNNRAWIFDPSGGGGAARREGK
jgi:hypothetical protein